MRWFWSHDPDHGYKILTQINIDLSFYINFFLFYPSISCLLKIKFCDFFYMRLFRSTYTVYLIDFYKLVLTFFHSFNIEYFFRLNLLHFVFFYGSRSYFLLFYFLLDYHIRIIWFARFVGFSWICRYFIF